MQLKLVGTFHIIPQFALRVMTKRKMKISWNSQTQTQLDENLSRVATEETCPAHESGHNKQSSLATSHSVT